MIVDSSILWPSSEKQFLHWGYVAGKLAPKWPLVRPLVVGMRGVKMGAAKTHKYAHTPTYDDTFLLVTGAPNHGVFVFPGATHAYQDRSKASPDVANAKGEDKKDGVGDVGSIRTGLYLLRDTNENPYPVFRLFNADGSEGILGHRDTDHDRDVSESEAKASETRGDKMTGILFHVGYNAPADSKHASSIGCQTADLQYLKLLRKAAAPTGGDLDFRLINAWEVVPIVQEWMKDLATPSLSNIA